LEPKIANKKSTKPSNGLTDKRLIQKQDMGKTAREKDTI